MDLLKVAIRGSKINGPNIINFLRKQCNSNVGLYNGTIEDAYYHINKGTIDFSRNIDDLNFRGYIICNKIPDFTTKFELWRY